MSVLAFSFIAVAGTPRALLIGVSDYGYDANWVDLGASRDVRLLAEALRQRGVADVRTLENAEADKAGIVSAINQLTEDVGVGDHIWLHWSGHGQRLQDDESDEEVDGLDEALVPYGAPYSVSSDYDGGAHLRDDELAEVLAPLRAAVGVTGSVVVVLDSCYSGTGTRFDLPVRGGAPPIVTRARRVVPLPSGTGSRDSTSSEGEAPLLTVSASRNDQVARETRGPDGESYGALSLALATALAGSADVPTWSGLFSEARGEMFRTAPGQEPQLDGARDLALFGGRIRQPMNSFPVDALISEREVRVSAGLVFGIVPGTGVSFFAPETVDPTRSELWARGRVTEAGATHAMVVLDEPPTRSLAAAWMFVDDWDSDLPILRVGLDASTQRARKWRTALSSIPLVEVVDVEPDILVRSHGPVVEVTRPLAPETILASAPTQGAALPSSLVDHVRNHATAELLRNVDLSTADRSVELAIIPVRECPEGDALGPPITTLHPDQRVAVIVRNTGTKSSYISVLYFMVDGTVQSLWPVSGNTPERLEPGAERRLLCRRVDGTSGLELLKAFATNRPMDFASLIGVRTGDRSAASELQEWIDRRAMAIRGPTRPALLGAGYSVELAFQTIPAPP